VAAVPHRPEPDWDLVLRRNSIERLKKEKFPLDIRRELPQLIARGYEAIPEEDLVRLNWWGITHDKPKIGLFMVRIRLPGGRLRPEQAVALGRLARQWAGNELEITTRQGLQMHQVPLARLPEVLDAVEGCGLTTVGGEGDTVRNVTSCPVAGVDRAELFDVRPVVEAASRFFAGHRDYSDLPRKFKVTIAACPAQCNAPDIHDVALVGHPAGWRGRVCGTGGWWPVQHAPAGTGPGGLHPPRGGGGGHPRPGRSLA